MPTGLSGRGEERAIRTSEGVRSAWIPHGAGEDHQVACWHRLSPSTPSFFALSFPSIPFLSICPHFPFHAHSVFPFLFSSCPFHVLLSPFLFPSPLFVLFHPFLFSYHLFLFPSVPFFFVASVSWRATGRVTEYSVAGMEATWRWEGF